MRLSYHLNRMYLLFWKNYRHLTYGTKPHPIQTSLMVFHNWDKPVQVVVFLFTFLLIRIIMAKHRALQTRFFFFLNRNSKSIFWDFCCFVFAKKKCIFRHFNTKMKWGFRPVSALEPDNLHILFFFKPLIYTLISWKICQNISIVSKTPPPLKSHMVNCISGWWAGFKKRFTSFGQTISNLGENSLMSSF